MKISVIIPVYNKNLYLDQLWNDLQAQTFRDYECIIIDDGSTDGSAKCCDNICAADPRFHVTHIQNQGVSHARNVGLDQACGEYVTFIDADDGLHPEYLSNLYRCLTESGADMVIGSVLKIWKDNNKKSLVSAPYHGLTMITDILPSFASVQMSTGIYGYCCSKLIRHSLFEGIRFSESVRLAEDLELYLSIYPKINSIYFDDKPYYCYFQATENSSMLTEDHEIDYYTQLLIQFKAYNMLKNMGYMYGENQSIYINRLYDYVFFTLYYSPMKDFYQYSQKIRALLLPSIPDLASRNLRQHVVLWMYKKNLDDMLYWMLSAYRKIRRLRY